MESGNLIYYSVIYVCDVISYIIVSYEMKPYNFIAYYNEVQHINIANMISTYLIQYMTM